MTENALHEGLKAAHEGDFARAEAIARSFLQNDPNDIHALQIIGFSNYCRGHNREALQAFLRANELEPDQAEILNWIGMLFKERNDFEQALKAFSRAAEIAPDNGDILCNHGEMLDLLGERERAAAQYNMAASLTPPSPVVMAKAARFFEKLHELGRARRFAETARSLEPGNEIALIALSDIDTREHNPEAVIDRLQNIVSETSANHRNQSKMFHLLAEACDRLGRYDEAYAAYSAANTLQRKLHKERVNLERSPLTPDNLLRMIDFFKAEDASKWTSHEDLEGETPVILVGFTRSGTTWLDQILSSHPDFYVMEEEDNFIDAWKDFLLSEAGLNRLKSLSAQEINRYRRAYWARATDRIKEGAGSARFIVDKVPLNTVQIGLIHRLFPDANYLFAVRDPRDSILSNFQQHFAINAAMFQFTSLESSAIFYDRVMTLGRLYRDKFPLRLHEVRYEHLVENLEREIRPLLEFLGAEWDPSVLAYDQTALTRAIQTPSARQVIQKPYATSIEKWRRYRSHMAPVLPVLNKWAAHFGYKTD